MNVSFYDIISLHIIPHSISLLVDNDYSSAISSRPTTHQSSLMQSFFQRRTTNSVFLLSKQNWPDVNAKSDLKLRLTSLKTHRWCLDGNEGLCS